MAAYIIFRIRVKDQKKLKAYQDSAPDIIKKYNGKIVVRGGDLLFLEGLEDSRRMVIIEFPSLEKAEEFYKSEEYAEAIKLRAGAADFEAVAIEGV